MSIKKIRKHISSQSGVSLLEVLMFVAILSIIVIAIAFSTVQSLKRTEFNRRNVFATRYAEELEEWIRSEKEVDWSVFFGRSPGTYCVNAEVSACDSGGTCWDENSACGSTDYSLAETTTGANNGYKRSVVLTTTGTRVDVDITVEWKDGPNVFDVNVASSLSRWE